MILKTRKARLNLLNRQRTILKGQNKWKGHASFSNCIWRSASQNARKKDKYNLLCRYVGSLRNADLVFATSHGFFGENTELLTLSSEPFEISLVNSTALRADNTKFMTGSNDNQNIEFPGWKQTSSKSFKLSSFPPLLWLVRFANCLDVIGPLEKIDFQATAWSQGFVFRRDFPLLECCTFSLLSRLSYFASFRCLHGDLKP